MNKDNPLTNVILAIIVIAVLLFAWLIGKSATETKEGEERKPPVKSTVGRNIFYLIIGIILILVFAKLWFALVGKPD
jgi:Na+/H+ antiporter NhaD/arsenite permease-like protein